MRVIRLSLLSRCSATILRILGAIALFCVSSRADEVDEFIQAQMKQRQIPGLSLAVLKNGKIIKEKGYGFASIELSAPATPETVYQLASITKTFTAMAVMKLVEDGKVALEDRIKKHLPELPKRWSEITVWNLVTHTSGIKNYTQLPAISEDPQKEFTQHEMLKLVADLPLLFRPGERYDYSNTGYYLLGMLIERLSGRTYGQFLEENIFKNAQMSATRVNSFSEIIPSRATGYVLRGDTIYNGIFVSPSQPFAAGALVTTAVDLAKWDAALYSGTILKPATLQQMWTPAVLRDGTVLNYGLGWGIREDRGRKYVQHNGGIIGFSSHIRRGLDDGLTVIVLLNLSSRGIIAEEIADGLMPLYQCTE